MKLPSLEEWDGEIMHEGLYNNSNNPALVRNKSLFYISCFLSKYMKKILKLEDTDFLFNFFMEGRK